MICPLTIASSYSVFITCKERDCAWWNLKSKACAVAEIAKNLDILACQGAR